MLREIVMTLKVVIPIKNQGDNREVLASVVVNRLLKQLSKIKATEHGYFLAVTKLNSIGHGDSKWGPQHVLFPVNFCCRIFRPVDGEVMMGIIRSVHTHGVFLKSGPMNIVYLSAHLMPDYTYVSGENDPMYVRGDGSKIGIGVVLRFKILAVRWTLDRWREFRVLASLNGDGLGQVSSNGYDELDL